MSLGPGLGIGGEEIGGVPQKEDNKHEEEGAPCSAGLGIVLLPVSLWYWIHSGCAMNRMNWGLERWLSG